jgi:hypothetical protein
MAGRIAYLGNIATQGLVLNLDAAIKGSYPGTGTTWTDVSNNGNNGTLTNGPTFTGSDYGAIVFDGTNDYVDITNNSNLNFGTSNFTSNVWIYPNTSSLITNREYGIINKNSGYQNFPGWGLELSTYGYSGSFPVVDIIGFNSGQTTWGNALVGNPIKTETWSNINLVRNGSRFDLYTNGSPSSVTTGSNVGFDTNNSANLTLAKNGSWQSSFKGNIANTQIYNQALTQFQVWQNFNSYKSRYGIPDIVTDGLVLNLDAGNPYSYLSGSSGTTWSNTVAVSSSISGTLVNGPVYSNGAITFDGVDDYVASTDIGLAGNVPITISFFGNQLTNQSGDVVSIFYGTCGTAYKGIGLYYRNSSNYVRFTTWQSTPGDYNTSFVKDFNVWHHWAVVYSNNSVLVYRDGIADSNGAQSRTIDFTSTKLALGGTINCAVRSNTKIGASQVYNRALSAAEVLQNFNALRGRYGI